MERTALERGLVAVERDLAAVEHPRVAEGSR
jgi:hypothetical protein